MDFKKQDFWPRINCIQMKLPDFESPSGDSLPKSANFGLSKWIFYVKNYPSFFLQNREKSKYRFLTFLPVTWVKIELQKGTIHQMNGWNLYFLVDFYAIVENSTWGALGPRMLLSNSSNHPLSCLCTLHFHCLSCLLTSIYILALGECEVNFTDTSDSNFF